uniref:DUF834 domain-containing protein n=1 Tax=Oryza meridionalis TaxID=40149 RepID=A0A0E0DXQ1_9ORYZ
MPHHLSFPSSLLSSLSFTLLLVRWSDNGRCGGDLVRRRRGWRGGRGEEVRRPAGEKNSGEAGAGWGEERRRPGESGRRTAAGRGERMGSGSARPAGEMPPPTPASPRRHVLLPRASVVDGEWRRSASSAAAHPSLDEAAAATDMAERWLGRRRKAARWRWWWEDGRMSAATARQTWLTPSTATMRPREFAIADLLVSSCSSPHADAEERDGEVVLRRAGHLDTAAARPHPVGRRRQPAQSQPPPRLAIAMAHLRLLLSHSSRHHSQPHRLISLLRFSSNAGSGSGPTPPPIKPVSYTGRGGVDRDGRHAGQEELLRDVLEIWS